MSIPELEQFIELGYYTRLKCLIKIADTLKGLIREELNNQDIARYVWTDHGVVGKFRNVKRYRYDHPGLKELLFNLGILPVTTTINTKLLSDKEKQALEEVSSDENQDETKVRFFSRNNLVDIFSSSKFLNLVQPDTSDCVYLWRELNRLIEELKKQWHFILSTIGSGFNEDKSEEIKTIYGKVIIQKVQKYFPLDVLNLLGNEVLLRCSHIDLEKLQEFAVSGFISKVEISKYRQMVNIDRQFLLMELFREERVDAWLFNRRKKLLEISVSGSGKE